MEKVGSSPDRVLGGSPLQMSRPPTVVGSVTLGVRGVSPVGGGSSARWAWRRAIAQQAGRIRSERSLSAVSPEAAFELEVVFFLLPARARDADVDNLARPVLNTLFDSRDEQADRTLTATLFDAEDAQIHRLILEKRVVADPAEEGIDVTVRWDARETAG